MALSMKSSAMATKAAARAVGVARPVLPAAPKAAMRAAPAARKAAVAKALPVEVIPMELAQVAGEAGFIGGVALTMTAITLVGLAIGFVLLRVESLAEEGKL